MFLRMASMAGALLAGLMVHGGAALAQYNPPPPAPYPAQSYPGRQLPPPVQAERDDDLDALGPPRTFGFPAVRPPQPIQGGVQSGGRGFYPPEADPYPPGAAYPNSGPPYGAPDSSSPDNALRPPISIGPDRAIAALPPDYQPETGPVQLPPQFRRTLVDYRTNQPAGTIVIDTPNTYLYLVLGKGKAMRYGIGVGREGFTWSGTERISNKAEWPDWHPPAEMIDRQPYLPRFMAGGESNPLGARALYLGKTEYRIHGTNQPSTIGTFVSSGCIRLTNDDVTDLYGRVQVGTRVVVLPGSAETAAQAANAMPPRAVETAPLVPPAPVRSR
jgi:lipoprotein-anchoring transpeptidase ErfK/SrfK